MDPFLSMDNHSQPDSTGQQQTSSIESMKKKDVEYQENEQEGEEEDEEEEESVHIYVQRRDDKLENRDRWFRSSEGC